MAVFERVRDILCNELSIDHDDVVKDATLRDLGADSLDIVTLVMEIEDEFDIDVPDSDVENLRTVGQIVQYIEQSIA